MGQRSTGYSYLTDRLPKNNYNLSLSARSMPRGQHTACRRSSDRASG